jgi:hypothetical protein
MQKANRDMRLSWLNLVTRNNYEKMQRSASAEALTEYGYFTGKYDQLDEKRKQENITQGFDLSSQESSTAFSSLVPPDVLKEWSKCKEDNADDGLTSWLSHVDPSGANLRIRWKPAAGLDEIRVTTTQSYGIASLPFPRGYKLGRGEMTIILVRSDPTKPMRGTINGSTGGSFGCGSGGSYTTDFYVAEYSAAKEAPVGCKFDQGSSTDWAGTDADQVKQKSTDIVIPWHGAREICLKKVCRGQSWVQSFSLDGEAPTPFGADNCTEFGEMKLEVHEKTIVCHCLNNDAYCGGGNTCTATGNVITQ